MISRKPSAESGAARETDAVRERYDARPRVDWRYSMLNPAEQLSAHERERAIARLLFNHGRRDLDDLTVTDVGCGGGGNLLMMLRLGCSPENLTGLELLAERFQRAKKVLPAAVRLIEGDASVAPVEPGSQDLVMQNLVFSSLLDDEFQHGLARAMWSWVKPGGAVLWHDFVFDNPRNRDVRGVRVSRVQQLFPEGQIVHQRVTLAPPIARGVTRVHPGFYGFFNRLPLLRTHVIAWISKPA